LIANTISFATIQFSPLISAAPPLTPRALTPSIFLSPIPFSSFASTTTPPLTPPVLGAQPPILVTPPIPVAPPIILFLLFFYL